MSLNLERVLEEQVFKHCSEQNLRAGEDDHDKKFTFSDRVQMLMNHRTVLIQKTNPATRTSEYTAELYPQWIGEKTKDKFPSYRIPLFFKWVLLNPREYYQEIDEEWGQLQDNFSYVLISDTKVAIEELLLNYPEHALWKELSGIRSLGSSSGEQIGNKIREYIKSKECSTMSTVMNKLYGELLNKLKEIIRKYELTDDHRIEAKV